MLPTAISRLNQKYPLLPGQHQTRSSSALVFPHIPLGAPIRAPATYLFSEALIDKNRDNIMKERSDRYYRGEITLAEHLAQMSRFFDPNNPNNATPASAESEEPFTPTTQKVLDLFYGPITPLPSPAASPPGLGSPFSPGSPPSTPQANHPATPDGQLLFPFSLATPFKSISRYLPPDTAYPDFPNFNPLASPKTPTPNLIRPDWGLFPDPDYDTDAELKQLESSSPDAPMSDLPSSDSPVPGDPSRLLFPRLMSPYSDMPDDEAPLGYPDFDAMSDAPASNSPVPGDNPSIATHLLIPRPASPYSDMPDDEAVLGYPESESEDEKDQITMSSSPLQPISALPLPFTGAIPLPRSVLPFVELDDEDLELGYPYSDSEMDASDSPASMPLAVTPDGAAMASGEEVEAESDSGMDASGSPTSQTETLPLPMTPHGAAMTSDEEVEEMVDAEAEEASSSSSPLSDLFRSDTEEEHSSPASSTSWGFSARKTTAPPRRIVTYAFRLRRILRELRERRVDIEEARAISHQLRQNSKTSAATAKLVARKAERRSRRHRRGRLGDLSVGVSRANESKYDRCELKINPLPIIDRQNYVTGVVAPPPAANEILWGDIMLDMNRAMLRINFIANFAHYGERESVYPFAITYGAPGNKPYLIEHTPEIAATLTALFHSGAIQMVSKYHNHLYQRMAPHSYAYALGMTQQLKARGIVTSPFTSSAFTSAAFNFGDAPSVPDTNDDAAIETFEAITVVGKFDEDEGGHLELQDENKIIKLSAGTTVLLATGSKPYKFSAVGKTEHLFLFRQWCSAGVFRWLCKGGRTDAEFQKDASFEDRLSWLNASHDRGVASIKLFSQLYDLYAF
ncbi:hypothetical protein R3P38DRAFT_3244084 [Favolaschia claudopus]|uniref:Uncharacterized protein n=1 Tax=Favolaschia claudopus TaxID=2862362 RepID=A0AAV9Z232_9AGAR